MARPQARGAAGGPCSAPVAPSPLPPGPHYSTSARGRRRARGRATIMVRGGAPRQPQWADLFLPPLARLATHSGALLGRQPYPPPGVSPLSPQLRAFCSATADLGAVLEGGARDGVVSSSQGWAGPPATERVRRVLGLRPGSTDSAPRRGRVRGRARGVQMPATEGSISTAPAEVDGRQGDKGLREANVPARSQVPRCSRGPPRFPSPTGRDSEGSVPRRGRGRGLGCVSAAAGPEAVSRKPEDKKGSAGASSPHAWNPVPHFSRGAARDSRASEALRTWSRRGSRSASPFLLLRAFQQ